MQDLYNSHKDNFMARITLWQAGWVLHDLPARPMGPAKPVSELLVTRLSLHKAADVTIVIVI